MTFFKTYMSQLKVAWTTFDQKSDAERIARDLVELNLAICVQVEEAVCSYYRWEGKFVSSTEFRLMIKFSETQSSFIERFIDENHPYEVPEWIVVDVEQIGNRYKIWALNDVS